MEGSQGRLVASYAVLITLLCSQGLAKDKGQSGEPALVWYVQGLDARERETAIRERMRGNMLQTASDHGEWRERVRRERCERECKEEEGLKLLTYGERRRSEARNM